MEPRDIKKLERFSKEVRESMEQTRPPPAPNKNMVDALEAFGRERLSKHYPDCCINSRLLTSSGGAQY